MTFTNIKERLSALALRLVRPFTRFLPRRKLRFVDSGRYKIDHPPSPECGCSICHLDDDEAVRLMITQAEHQRELMRQYLAGQKANNKLSNAEPKTRK